MGKCSSLDQSTHIEKDDLGETEIICQIILLDRILGKLKSASSPSRRKCPLTRYILSNKLKKIKWT